MPDYGNEFLERLEGMRQPLLRYCRQLTGSPWEADDLVQDTIVRLLRAAADRPERELGYRYACRTARNLWIDRCRRAKRVTPAAHADAAELAGSAEGRQQTWGTAERERGAGARLPPRGSFDVREHLEELAWRLPPRPFVILLLMEVFEFTAKETAALLGGTETAVQVALSRARARLRSLGRSAKGSQDGPHRGGRAQEAGPAGGTAGWRRAAAAAEISAGSADFFEAVLGAFHRRDPVAIQQAYLVLAASGGCLQGIRALGGRLIFTFRDPDGNLMMVST